jgi:predicted MFS family arabinose efflux permease
MFNDGLLVMKMLAMKELFKTNYGLEPSQVQVNNSVIYVPALFKIVYGLIVDSRVVKKRKYFLIVGGALSSICMFVVSFNILSNSEAVVKVLFLSVLADTFVDSVMDSLVVQQARIDKIHGQSDLVCLRMMCFGIGAFFGAIIGAVLIQFYSVLIPFGVCGVIVFISTVGACFMPDSLETNEFGTAIKRDENLGFLKLAKE